MVADGEFRDDLYYRINIFPVEMPPLRERRDDIPALAFHFLRLFSEELDKTVSQISVNAMALPFAKGGWGNFIVIANLVHRAVILTGADVIRQSHLMSIMDMEPRLDLEVPRTNDELKEMKKMVREKAVEKVERLFLLEALKRNDWNVTRAAAETGLQRTNFQSMMKKFHIRIRDQGPPG